MDSILLWIEKNPIVTGGIVLALASSIYASFRGHSARLWEFLFRRLVCQLEVNNFDHFYEAIRVWISTQESLSNSKFVTVSSGESGSGIRRFSSDGEDESDKAVTTPSNGLYWFKWKGIWCWSYIYYAEETSKNLNKPFEKITIGLLTRDRKKLQQLIDEIKVAKKEYDSKEKFLYYLADYGDWNYFSKIPDRPLNSIFLPDGQLEDLREDLASFLSRKSFYKSLGVPYSRGYLFYGKPGSGKSSLIKALAKEFNLNLYYMNLSQSMTDEKLLSSYSAVKEGSIIFLEDIDSLFNQRENTGSSGVSFSGLLNCFDGVLSKENIILIMTTNHIEKLDPALFRTGRVDYKIEFTEATSSQVKRLFTKVYGYELTTEQEKNLEEKMAVEKLSMSDFQNMFLTEKNPSNLFI